MSEDKKLKLEDKLRQLYDQAEQVEREAINLDDFREAIYESIDQVKAELGRE